MRTFLLVLAAGAFFAAAPARAADHVSIGVVNSSSDIPFYIAKHAGYFDANGIDVAFQNFNSAAQMIAPLGSGNLDVGAGSVSAGLYNAVDRGIDIRIVADKARCAPGFGYVAFLVRKELVDSGAIKTFADFKGRKVSLGGTGTGDSSTLNEALKTGGLGFNDVDLVYMSFSQQAAAFQNGAIDASMTAEPNVTLAAKGGTAVRFAGVDDVYPNQQTAVLMYGGGFAKQRPDVAKRFMKAYILALRDYNGALQNGKLAGPKANAVIDLLQRYTSVKDLDVLRTMVPHAVDPDGALNIEGLEKDHAFFVQQKLTPASLAMRSVVDESFRKAALAELAGK